MSPILAYLCGLATLPAAWVAYKGLGWLFWPGYRVHALDCCHLCGARWWVPRGLYRFTLRIAYKDHEERLAWPLALHLRMHPRCLAKAYRGLKRRTLHRRRNGIYEPPYRLPAELVDPNF